MSTPGSVTVVPGKRFLDLVETLDPADLDALARPVISVNTLSIGAGQLIAADVVEIIKMQGLGIPASFIFTSDRSVQVGFVLPMGSVSVAGAKVGTPVWCQQISTVPTVTFAALVTAGNIVTLYATPDASADVTIPSGTLVNMRIFT